MLSGSVADLGASRPRSFYWLAIIAYIGFSAWKEGRMPRTQRYTARQAKLADLKARRGVNTEA